MIDPSTCLLTYEEAAQLDHVAAGRGMPAQAIVPRALAAWRATQGPDGADALEAFERERGVDDLSPPELRAETFARACGEAVRWWLARN